MIKIDFYWILYIPNIALSLTYAPSHLILRMTVCSALLRLALFFIPIPKKGNAKECSNYRTIALISHTMATHSSTLAWKIPWAEEPGRLQSMGSLRVGCDWATSLSLFTFMHWRRKWQPTPVFLPGESQGWGSLVGCHLWGHTELDTTEVT